MHSCIQLKFEVINSGTHSNWCGHPLTSWKKILCSAMERLMENSRGLSEVQKVLPSMRAIWVLTGWCLRRCFFGGIMSARISLWGSMISVTVLPVTSASSWRQWWDCMCVCVCVCMCVHVCVCDYIIVLLRYYIISFTSVCEPLYISLHCICNRVHSLNKKDTS